MLDISSQSQNIPLFEILRNWRFQNQALSCSNYFIWFHKVQIILRDEAFWTHVFGEATLARRMDVKLREQSELRQDGALSLILLNIEDLWSASVSHMEEPKRSKENFKEQILVGITGEHWGSSFPIPVRRKIWKGIDHHLCEQLWVHWKQHYRNWGANRTAAKMTHVSAQIGRRIWNYRWVIPVTGRSILEGIPSLMFQDASLEEESQAYARPTVLSTCSVSRTSTSEDCSRPGHRKYGC